MIRFNHVGKIVLSFFLAALLQLPVMADTSFPNIGYVAGYPHWNKSVSSGSLLFGSDSLAYQNTATQEQFLIPYNLVTGIGYKGKITQRDTHGALLGGPNPYVLAATVGASILANVLSKPSTSGAITCHFSYVDEKTQQPTMVYFSVDNQKTADAIVATFKERHDHMRMVPAVQTISPQEEAALDQVTTQENPYLIPAPNTQADLKFGY